MISTEPDLIRLAVALGAASTGGVLSAAERRLVAGASRLTAPAPSTVSATVAAIRDGADPFGDAFCRLRDTATRRAQGAVYTPSRIITPMLDWVLSHDVARVVDGGSGSGRFIAEVIRRRPDTAAIAIDADPVASLMTRATLAALNARTVRVVSADYTQIRLPKVSGATAFIGNPPYVRHHQLSPEAKQWAQQAANKLGHRISGLAGLHSYFFLATALLGRTGDLGCFVTSAEWLDVNYGAIMRTLLLDQLGGESLHVIEPKALPFEGTQTTAVVTTFKIATKPSTVRMQDVESLDQLTDLATSGQPVSRARLVEAPRWGGLLRSSSQSREGFIQLGELCRVHRGTVTGANSTWVVKNADELPEAVLFPAVTKARELFAAGDVLNDPSQLRRVIDIPTDLDDLGRLDRRSVERFIRAAKQAGVHKGYIAAHRRSWWSVGLKEPAPILATYMARRPPAFVLNAADARHINIAHGLYPRQPLSANVLDRLAESLRTGVALSQGRVYAGGLTKFEPKEMERLLIPDLAILRGHEPLSPALDA